MFNVTDYPKVVFLDISLNYSQTGESMKQLSYITNQGKEIILRGGCNIKAVYEILNQIKSQKA
jgi:hypothetical protein